MDNSKLCRCDSDSMAEIQYYQILNRILETISCEINFSKTVKAILKMIGTALNADRCYIFDITKDNKFCSNTFEWTSECTLAEIKKLQYLPMENFADFMTPLREHRTLVIDSVENPPEAFASVATFLALQHIKSIYVVGLYEGDRMCGFLGVDFVKNPFSFSSQVLQMLQSAVKLFSIALEREKKIQLIKKQNLKLRQATKEALAADHAKSMFLASMSHEIRTPLNARARTIDCWFEERVGDPFAVQRH